MKNMKLFSFQSTGEVYSIRHKLEELEVAKCSMSFF